MITVQEAQEIILKQKLSLGIEKIPIHAASGRVLAADILADRDAPPFDRATMDGIAIDTNHFNPGIVYRITGMQAAGMPQGSLLDPNDCLEVMTGAMMPKGTNGIIPYEQITIKDGLATPKLGSVEPYMNIHLRGTDAKKGQVLIPKGTRLHAATIGVIAAAGVGNVGVATMPRVIVCSTGDELIPIEQEPLPHQIRNSNASMLQAALRQVGIQADTKHLRDEKKTLTAELEKLKDSFDILMFSGAVSKGKFDYLPEVLRELGMESLIHGVAQRPGKPFLFGRFDRSLVFGFPGNPASTLICFHTFFVPWLLSQQGLEAQSAMGELDSEIVFKKSLTYHLLVSIRYEGSRAIASPIANSGSGDLIHLGKADGFLSLPPESDTFNKGSRYPITNWRALL
ncbi:molybdopterin molybdotransferase MoeA [Lunatimonas salinarum]|uniref:molybdopterin molybdotransferase MoeA n=1 Tax=Lunatimonas salinarum TaxID=1774590 RepID=UPI001AE03243|nr:molybdopterin molybdotransferase MoeA [Lunatimonas salinarum]